MEFTEIITIDGVTCTVTGEYEIATACADDGRTSEQVRILRSCRCEVDLDPDDRAQFEADVRAKVEELLEFDLL